MRVCDLIQLPVRSKGSAKEKASQGGKVPTWHLTSEEAMKYIAESNDRTKAKRDKTEGENRVKHEAVLAHCRKKCQPVKRK